MPLGTTGQLNGKCTCHHEQKKAGVVRTGPLLHAPGSEGKGSAYGSQKEGVGCPRAIVGDGREASRGFRDVNPGPLQEQVLLATELGDVFLIRVLCIQFASAVASSAG